MIHTARFYSCHSSSQREPMRTTLPSMPFDVPPATHDETAPRSAPIRVKGYAEIPMRKNSSVRMIVEYASSVNFDCSIEDAAVAVGVDVNRAQTLMGQAGITGRFKQGKRKSAFGVGYGEDRPGDAMRGAASAKARGRRVDENLLPLDLLIR